MFSRLIDHIEGIELSVPQWIGGFLGIVFIRFFLENFSSPVFSFSAAPNGLTLIHYGLFYFAVLLAVSLAIRIVVPDIAAISKFVMFAFPVCWLPPIIDLLISHGTGAHMAYVFATGSRLWSDFLTIGGPYAFGGITPGIKTELILIILGIFIYVFTKTKNIWKAIAGTVIGYAAIFIMIALPSFFALFAGFSRGLSGPSLQSSLIYSFSFSHIMTNFIRPTDQLSFEYAIETAFNLGMAYILYILDFLLMVIWFIVYSPQKSLAFLKNVRPARMLHYWVLIALGILFAAAKDRIPLLSGSADILVFIALLVSYLCAWMFAVGANDLVDVAIDRVSNNDRPLVRGSLTESDLSSSNILFIFWALLGGFIGGYWAFFTICVFTAAYYIYSAPPLRFKRIPLVSTFLISIACLSALMSGFYAVDIGKVVSDFPMRIVLLVIVFYTLSLNMKDVKDIEGDRAEGINTIPVIFGNYGREVVGGLVAVALFSIPIILRLPILFWPSLVAAVLGYIVINKKPYREWVIFVIYFAYIITALFLLL